MNLYVPSGQSSLMTRSRTYTPINGIVTVNPASGSDILDLVQQGCVPMGQPQTLGQRLRAALSEAQVNPLNQPPMEAVAAWAEDTAFLLGNIVSNGGNLYLCAQGGTTIVSGSGPSGTAAQVQSDGTCKWYFYGVPATPTANGPTVSVATSVPGPLTLAYLPSLGPGSNFQFSGGELTNNPSIAFENYLPAVTISATAAGNTLGHRSSNGPIKMTFWTDAPKFTIDFYGTDCTRLIINGQYVSLSGYVVTYEGGHGYLTVDFGGVRQSRLITIVAQANTYFSNVWVDPASKVWKPNAAISIISAFIGDSLCAGGAAFPILPDEYWMDVMAYQLGWSNVVNQGIGGTGYTAQGTATAYFNFPQRPASDLTAINPDIVFVWGGQNDALSTLKAAALAYFQQLRTIVPNAMIVVMGRWPAPSSGGSAAASVIQSEQAIETAFLSWADSNSVFIPITLNPAGSPITGTGNITSTTGTGNGDVYIASDGTHPTEAGRIYLGNWMAQQMLPIIANSL